MAAIPGGAARASPAGNAPLDRAVRGGDPIDLWLRRQLQKAFGTVLSEPVPDSLLQMIRQGIPEEAG
jgi:hypothetical protein